ncbi:MAG TPA: GTPase [Polyangiaceae bacterium]|nr:GTPase [Polyangiaceae bacterium]
MTFAFETAGLSRAAREAVGKLDEHVRETQEVLALVLRELDEELRERFAALEKDADHVTVTVFGKTRTGKSTLLAALVGGSGDGIGTGRQHTTKEIREYFWPPETRELRLVDTPGVEGLNGAELAEKAQRFVERSDHILFMLTDDVQTAGELDYLGAIRTLGKSATFVLNVKADPELLPDHAEYVFRDHELDGHMRRIRGYVRDQMDEDDIMVVPIHALAAWRSQQVREPGRRHALWAASRVDQVEASIRDFVERSAISARMSSPRHLLTAFLLQAIDQLVEPQRAVELLAKALVAQAGATRATLRGASFYARDKRPDVVLGIDGVLQRIPREVDDLIAASADGTTLSEKYAEMIEGCGLAAASGAHRSSVIDYLKTTLEEQIAAAAFDASVGVDVGDLGAGLEEANSIRSSRKWRRAVRRTIRSGTASAVVAGTSWAIGNFWNPSGWLAAVGVAIVIASGIAAQKTAKYATEAWAKADELRLASERNRIIDGLVARTRAERSRLLLDLEKWEKKLFTDADRDLVGGLEAARAHVDMVRRVLGDGIRELESSRQRIERDLVHQAASLVIPEIREGRIVIEAVHRTPGIGTKLLLRGTAVFGAPIGACVGRGGERARLLRTALGGEPVSFIDASAPLADQVASSMQPARATGLDVEIPQSPHAPILVRLTGQELSRAVGRAGANVVLAQRVFGRRIRIVERTE